MLMVIQYSSIEYSWIHGFMDFNAYALVYNCPAYSTEAHPTTGITK